MDHNVQLKDRQDGYCSDWIPSNAHQVAGGHYFVNDKLPSEEYILLVTPHLNGSFGGMTMVKGMC